MRDSGAALRIGFVGAGFMARFHLRSLLGVRNAVVAGVLQPRRLGGRPSLPLPTRRASARARPFEPRGDAELRRRSTRSGSRARTTRASRRCARSIALVKAGRSVFAPSPARSRSRAPSPRRARCCAWPRMRACNHGYLENQLFSTAVQRGKRDHLAPRRAEQPAGPISRAPPRSIAARTSPGSGRARSRAAACSPT